MSSIFYMVRNGHKYAYCSKSIRVPGRKNPKTLKTYLGKVDPETGKIIPKTARSQPKEEIAKFYGAVQVLDAIQERLSLFDDLKSVFGTMASNIMGAAIALAISPSSMDSIHYTIEGSIIAEKYKLRGTLSPAVISTLSEELGKLMGSMDRFFTKRIHRNKSSTYSLDLTSVSTYSNMDGWAQWGHNRDGEALKQTNIAMITDSSGIPVMFRMLPGSIADMAIMQSTVDEMQRLGCSGRYVMDRGFECAKNVLSMLELGVEFTIPSNLNAEPIKKLLALATPKMKQAEACAFHENAAYKYAEFQVGIWQDDKKTEYVIEVPPNRKDAKENNERFAQSKKLKAFVVFDPEKAKYDFQKVMEMIHNIELKLENTKHRNPKKVYMDLPPFVRKYIDYEVDDEGLFHIVRKQNAFTFADNRAGLFVMLASTETSFEQMMTSYDVRDWVEKAFDVYKTDLEGNRYRTGNPERARGRLFIKFLSLILRIEMQNKLREHNKEIRENKLKPDSVCGMTINDTLLSLNTLYAIGNTGEWRLTAVSKNVREIFHLFGLPEPISGKIILS